MAALSSYIHGFWRTPEDSRNYTQFTNAILTSAYDEVGIDETNVVSVQWMPYNELVWVIIVYKA